MEIGLNLEVYDLMLAGTLAPVQPVFIDIEGAGGEDASCLKDPKVVYYNFHAEASRKRYTDLATFNVYLD
jgi:hypothetical protein